MPLSALCALFQLLPVSARQRCRSILPHAWTLAPCKVAMSAAHNRTLTPFAAQLASVPRKPATGMRLGRPALPTPMERSAQSFQAVSVPHRHGALPIGRRNDFQGCQSLGMGMSNQAAPVGRLVGRTRLSRSFSGLRQWRCRELRPSKRFHDWTAHDEVGNPQSDQPLGADQVAPGHVPFSIAIVPSRGLAVNHAWQCTGQPSDVRFVPGLHGLTYRNLDWRVLPCGGGRGTKGETIGCETQQGNCIWWWSTY